MINSLSAGRDALRNSALKCCCAMRITEFLQHNVTLSFLFFCSCLNLNVHDYCLHKWRNNKLHFDDKHFCWWTYPIYVQYCNSLLHSWWIKSNYDLLAFKVLYVLRLPYNLYSLLHKTLKRSYSCHHCVWIGRISKIFYRANHAPRKKTQDSIKVNKA